VCLHANERFSTQIQHALQMEALSLQVDLSRFHDVSPTENFPVGEIEVCSEDTACLDQRSKLEVYRVHVGMPPRIMTESTIRIMAAKRPVGGLVDRSPACFGIFSDLAQNKDRIEAGMHVPSRIFSQLPSSIGALVPEDALHDCIGLRGWLANEPIKMHQVEGGGHMILQIPVRRLVLGHVALKSEPVLAGKIRAEDSIEQREETCGVQRQFRKSLVYEEAIHHFYGIDPRLLSQGVQANDPLHGVVEDRQVGLRVQAAGMIDKNTVRLLVALDELR